VSLTAQTFDAAAASIAAMREPELGHHLRRLRERSGLSQEDAAHRVGVSLGGYRAWEHGRVPRPGNRRRLAALFSVPVGELESYMVSLRDKAPEPARLDRIEAKLDAVIELLAPMLAEDAATTLSGQAAEAARRAERKGRADSEKPPGGRRRTGRGGRAA